MERVEDFVRRWLATYTDGDLDGAMACYTDDVVFEDPIFNERVVGRDKLRAAFAQFFHSGVTQLHFERWTGGAEGGAVEWRWHANWGPDRTFLGFDAANKRFEVRGVSVLELRDGCIRRQVDLWDLRAAVTQLGAWHGA